MYRTKHQNAAIKWDSNGSNLFTHLNVIPVGFVPGIQCLWLDKKTLDACLGRHDGGESAISEVGWAARTDQSSMYDFRTTVRTAHPTVDRKKRWRRD